MVVKRSPHNAIKRCSGTGPCVGLSLFVVMISASRAMACSVCMTALIDRMLPPVGLWTVFAVGWFLALVCLCSLRRVSVRGVPSVLGALMRLVSLGVIGLIGLGPIGFLLLFVSPVMVAVQACSAKSRRHWGGPLVRDVKIIMGVGLIVSICLSAYSAYIHNVRSPADYAIQWENTYSGRQILASLAHRGQDALPNLRYTVAHSKPATVARFVDRIATFGQPETDVPLLILALGRCKGDRICEGKVSAALRKLTGLALASHTSAKDWQQHWKGRATARIETSGSVQ